MACQTKELALRLKSICTASAAPQLPCSAEAPRKVFQASGADWRKRPAARKTVPATTLSCTVSVIGLTCRKKRARASANEAYAARDLHGQAAHVGDHPALSKQGLLSRPAVHCT